MEYTFTAHQYFVFPNGTRVLKEDLEKNNPELYNEIMIQAAQIGFNKISEYYGLGVEAVRKTKK